MDIFQSLYEWFETFLNELPPLLQLVLGMLIAVGVYKLLALTVDALKKSGSK